MAAVRASTPVQRRPRRIHNTKRTKASIASAIGLNSLVKSQLSRRLAVIQPYIRRTSPWMWLSSHDGTSDQSREPTTTIVVSSATISAVRSRWFGRSTGAYALSAMVADATATDAIGSELLAGDHTERVGSCDHSEPGAARVDDRDR